MLKGTFSKGPWICHDINKAKLAQVQRKHQIKNNKQRRERRKRLRASGTPRPGPAWEKQISHKESCQEKRKHENLKALDKRRRDQTTRKQQEESTALAAVAQERQAS